MTLFLDCTPEDRNVLGVLVGKRRILRQYQSPRDRSSEILWQTILRCLRAERVPLVSLTRIVVVAGPGRFSRLRGAATIANILRFAKGCSIGVVRSASPFPYPVSQMRALVQRARTVSSLRPYYGHPPSITPQKIRARRSR